MEIRAVFVDFGKIVETAKKWAGEENAKHCILALFHAQIISADFVVFGIFCFSGRFLF